MRTSVSTRALYVLAATALRLALSPAGASADIHAEYREQIASYARGDRAPAVAGLARLSDDALPRVAAAGEAAALAAQRDHTQPPFPLRAAVMLHMDLDEAERPAAEGREQARPCPGRHAGVAARYARLLAWRPETKDFSRRFFVALAHRSQWDACMPDAQRWAGEGLKLFPRDPELLLAAGSALEESATLWLGVSVASPAMTTSYRQAALHAASDRRAFFERARGMYADAAAADPDRVPARVRLGRVLWRLGRLPEAQAALDDAVSRPAEADVLYLAHLFLGRVHEDAGRLEPALRHYRLALALDPQAQTAATALSHALRLAGEDEESRQVLRRALDMAGRRRRDAYWDYLAGDAARVEDEFAALRQESLE
jgi:tetratricopeptide (TPR) repeat protein